MEEDSINAELQSFLSDAEEFPGFLKPRKSALLDQKLHKLLGLKSPSSRGEVLSDDSPRIPRIGFLTERHEDVTLGDPLGGIQRAERGDQLEDDDLMKSLIADLEGAEEGETQAAVDGAVYSLGSRPASIIIHTGPDGDEEGQQQEKDDDKEEGEEGEHQQGEEEDECEEKAAAFVKDNEASHDHPGSASEGGPSSRGACSPFAVDIS